jgi:hypothetical protein
MILKEQIMNINNTINVSSDYISSVKPVTALAATSASSDFKCLLDSAQLVDEDPGSIISGKPSSKQLTEIIYGGTLEELYKEPFEYWTKVTPIATKMLYTAPGQNYSEDVWNAIVSSPDPLKSFNALSGRNLEMPKHPSLQISEAENTSVLSSDVTLGPSTDIHKEELIHQKQDQESVINIVASDVNLSGKPGSRVLTEKIYGGTLNELYKEPFEYWTKVTPIATKMLYTAPGENLSVDVWGALMQSPDILKSFNALTGENLQMPERLFNDDENKVI